MELTQVIVARAIQLAKVTTIIGWIPDIFADIAQKYEFAVVPKPQDLFRKEPNNSAEFKHGRIGKDIINTLTIFNDGFVADSSISTEVSELFLKDLMQMLIAKNPEVKEAGRPLYLSSVEVKLDFGRFGQLLANIGAAVSRFLQQYGNSNVDPYLFSTLHLAEDQLGKALKPSAFTIERRINVPFSDNLFFSQAPLKTADHLILIQSLEGALAQSN